MTPSMTSSDTDNTYENVMRIKSQRKLGCEKKERRKYKPWKRSEPAPVMIPTAMQSATVKTVAAFSVTVLLSVPAIVLRSQKNAKNEKVKKKAKSQSLVVKREKTKALTVSTKPLLRAHCSHGTRTYTIRLETEYPQPQYTSEHNHCMIIHENN